MRVLSTLLVYAGYNQYAMNVQQAEQFLGGLIYGLIQKDDFKEIQKCIKDGETVEKELTDALSYFAKGDVKDVIKGIEEIGELLQGLGTDLDDCEGMQGDFQRIEKWATIFQHPSKLVETLTTNLIKNYAKIFGDISKAESDIGQAKWEPAGEDIADILVLTLGAVPKLNEYPEDLEFTQW